MLFNTVERLGFALEMKTSSVALIFSRSVMTLTGDMMEFRTGSSVRAVTSIQTAASSIQSSVGASTSTDARGNI